MSECGGDGLTALSFYLGNARLDVLVASAMPLAEITPAVIAALRQTSGREIDPCEDDPGMIWQCRDALGRIVPTTASCLSAGLVSGSILTLTPAEDLPKVPIDDPAVGLAQASRDCVHAVSGDAGRRQLLLWSVVSAVVAGILILWLVLGSQGALAAGLVASDGAMTKELRDQDMGPVAGTTLTTGVLLGMGIGGGCVLVRRRWRAAMAVRFGQWVGLLAVAMMATVLIGQLLLGVEKGGIIAVSAAAATVLGICSPSWVGYLGERRLTQMIGRPVAGQIPTRTDVDGGEEGLRHADYRRISQEIRAEMRAAYAAGALVLCGGGWFAGGNVTTAGFWSVIMCCWAFHARRLVDSQLRTIVVMGALVAMVTVALAAMISGVQQVGAYVAAGYTASAITAAVGLFVRRRFRLRWSWFIHGGHHLMYLLVAPTWLLMTLG